MTPRRVNTLQFRVLYRQFLLRVVDLELLAPQGDITKLLGQFVALLAIVSLWILLPSVGLAARASSPDLGLRASSVSTSSGGPPFCTGSSDILVRKVFCVQTYQRKAQTSESHLTLKSQIAES